MDVESEPVEYIKRTRRYYRALGYETPYEWAHFESVPFSLPAKPVSESTVGIVSTAAPYNPDKGDQGPGAPYNACLLYTSPSPRDRTRSRMPSSA